MSREKHILVTGGTGFIGSNLVNMLRAQGRRAVVVDRLGNEGKWRYFQDAPLTDLIAPDELPAWLDAHGGDIEAIAHMGAISATTATDADLAWRTNVRLSQELWSFAAKLDIPLVYASSAATYGAAATSEAFAQHGALGLEGLERLKPLNLYGWSKQAFDLWVARQVERGKNHCPKHWAALKFFNVYGPHEAHKGDMGSVVRHFYRQYRETWKMRLFRSLDAAVPHGMQKRDFIWIGDVVRIIGWCLDNPVRGIFNVGTGQPRTFLDMAHCVLDAFDLPRHHRAGRIEFIDMPRALRGQYQAWTCADISRLRRAGYDAPMTSLEEGVASYAQYLKTAEAAG